MEAIQSVIYGPAFYCHKHEGVPEHRDVGARSFGPLWSLYDGNCNRLGSVGLIVLVNGRYP